jgi:hypothetical protein
MVLIRLTGPPAAPDGPRDLPQEHQRAAGLAGPHLVTDVIWANAVPADRLEYVHARAGPSPGTVDLVLFHRADDTDDDEAVGGGTTALILCHRAIANSPSLRAWTARPLD